MKKFITIVLALAMGVVLLGCSQTNDVAIESDEELFTLQAISSTSLLSYNELNIQETAFSPLSEVTTENETIEEPVITEEVENIDYYVEMMELFLGDENLTVTSLDSDNELYQFMTTYQVVNLNGEDVTYTFYYNEYIVDENQELIQNENTQNDEQKQSKKFHFTDEDDNSVALGIEGILTFGDITYNIEGKKILNSQQEIYRLRSFIDEDNYVMVNYQNDTTDREKEKFFFKLVEDGVVVNESKVMIFSQANRLHLKLEFTEGENYSNYIFNINTDGDTKYIHIVYKIKNGEDVEEGVVKLTAEIDAESGEVIYTYDMAPNKTNKQYQNQYRHGHQNQGSSNRR
ncbi:MAG: hypothetical protein WC152_08345 [Candidatus Izemoplasmatales bacterium]